MYFDSHAHIASSPKAYDDIHAVIKRACDCGVERIVDAAIDIKTSKAVLQMSQIYPNLIIPTLGLQPELLIPGSDIYLKSFDIGLEIKKLREFYFEDEGQFKAVGECGLDYYWVDKLLDRKQQSKVRGLQRILLKQQIEFAKEVKLPLIVHSRGAEEECLQIINSKLKVKDSKVRILFHSYTGDLEIARRIFEAGYYISFNGILTYASAEDIRTIFRLGWKSFRKQVLSETDSPYLVPRGGKGRVCEPGDVKFVVEEMANLIGESVEDVAYTIFENAERFYSIDT